MALQSDGKQNHHLPDRNLRKPYVVYIQLTLKKKRRRQNSVCTSAFFTLSFLCQTGVLCASDDFSVSMFYFMSVYSNVILDLKNK